MTPRKFFMAAFLAMVLLAAGNVCVRWMGRHSVLREVMRRLSASEPATEVVVLGNSLVQSGFDPEAFASAADAGAAPRTSLNGGLGATGPIQHLLMGRAVLRNRKGVRILVYGGVDFMFTEASARPWCWTQQTGNNAMIFQDEPEIAAPHVDTSEWGRRLFRIAAGVPMYVERGTPWTKVEILRRTMGGWGLPEAATNQFGRTVDFRELVSRDTDQFVRVAAKAVAGRDPLAPPVAALLAVARDRGVGAVVVLMPVPPERFPCIESPEWQAYVAHLRAILAEQGCGLIVASDWIRDAGKFSDVLHLNAQGAAEFSGRLAGELRRAGL